MIENTVYLKNFQPRQRRWVHHGGMAGIAEVANYFLDAGVYFRPHYRVA